MSSLSVVRSSENTRRWAPNWNSVSLINVPNVALPQRLELRNSGPSDDSNAVVRSELELVHQKEIC